jgi:hypothetical protein
VIEALTAREVLEMYRPNLEQFEQAMPILVVDDGDAVNFATIVGVEVPYALDQMVLNGDRYQAVLMSAEARITAYDLETGLAETEGPVDAAMFTYADRTGKYWAATQRFMRVNGKVTYIGGLEEAAFGIGAVQSALERLVGR